MTSTSRSRASTCRTAPATCGSGCGPRSCDSASPVAPTTCGASCVTCPSAVSPRSTRSRCRGARSSSSSSRTTARTWRPSARSSPSPGPPSTDSPSTRRRTQVPGPTSWTTMAEAAVLSTGSAAPPSRRRRNWVPYALLLPGILWLLLFFVLPMVTLASQSLQEGNVDDGYVFTANFGIYVDALKQYWPQFVRSFVYAGTATALALLLGYPLAYFIALKAGRHKNLVLVLVIAPFFTSFLIRTLAWRTILSDDWFVATWAQNLHITDFLQAVGLTDNDSLLNSQFAVIMGLTYNFLPFMILPLYTSLERLDPRLIEAAGDLYASAWQTFRRVTWPLSLPGVVAGTLLTFIPAAGDFINARLLGNTQTTMIGSVIDSQFLRVLDYPLAAALSFILLVLIVAMVSVYVRRAGTEELLR